MKSLMTGMTLVCAATVLSPHAIANTQDDNFLEMLASAGIPAHDGIPRVIAAGHEVCGALDSGEPASAIADTLANDAYADAPVNPLDQYQRSMVRFVQVSARAFCPGHAGRTASHGNYRVVLIDDVIVPHPPPAVPEGPNMTHLAPPAVVATPKQNPPPEHRVEPPEAVVPPAQGSPGDHGQGSPGTGGDGGGNDSGGNGAEPAPGSSGGHIVLLP